MKSLCWATYKDTHIHNTTKLVTLTIADMLSGYHMLSSYILSTSEQEACKEKSLKQLITHCSISKPRVSSVLTVDRSNPGLGEQHISTRVSWSLRSTSNYTIHNKINKISPHQTVNLWNFEGISSNNSQVQGLTCKTTKIKNTDMKTYLHSCYTFGEFLTRFSFVLRSLISPKSLEWWELLLTPSSCSSSCNLLILSESSFM